MNNISKKNIIWLASYPKSGSTWFRILLANLFSISDSPISINSIDDSPIASSRSIFDTITGIDSSELSKDEINNLRPEVYRSLANSSNEDLYIKVHDAWFTNKNGKPIFPPEITKAVLYIIRNPFDIAESYSYHFGISIDEAINRINNTKNRLSDSKDRISNQIPQKLLSWSEHVLSWIDNSSFPVHIVRYEDLSSDTFITFSKAIRFIDLEFDDQSIYKAIKNSDFTELSRQEDEFGFQEKSLRASKFFRSGSVSDINVIANNLYYNRLKANHKNVMQRFGYYL